MSINSRNKWNTYERKLCNEYKELWFQECVTSRSESKRTDDRWIDLCYTDPFNIQAKAYKSFWWAQIIRELKNITQNTKDHKLGSNFNLVHLKIDKPWERGEIVCLSKDDWYEIVEMLKGNSVI